MALALEASIARATSEVADGLVDWSANLEICDAVNAAPAALAPVLVASISKRLTDGDAKVQRLAITLVQTCVSNGGAEVHAAVGTKPFLGHIAKVGETSSDPATRDAALGALQTWGLAFAPRHAAFPAYGDVYTFLKVKGVAFPDADDQAAPVFFDDAPADPAAAAAQASSSTTTGRTTPSDDPSGAAASEAAAAAAVVRESDERQAAMAKLRADLETVAEKIALCAEMLPNSPGIARGDDALAEVVGFLEACRPRMLELIDAGSSGALSDDVLAYALKVNDDLAKALQDEIDSASGAHQRSETAAATTTSAAPGGTGESTQLAPSPATVAPGPPPTSSGGEAVPPSPLDPLDIDEDDDEDEAKTALTRATGPPAVAAPPPQPDTTTGDLLDLSSPDDGAGVVPLPPPPVSQSPQQPDLL